MGDWLLNLPVLWMALIVFVATYLTAGGIYLIVIRLGERTSKGLQGGFAWNATAVGYPFCPISWLHRRRGVEQFR